MKRNIVYLALIVAVVVLAYLGSDFLKPYLYPCESIFQQTATQIGGRLETIKAKGALFIGQKKIQELTERSQMLGLNLKTCCTLSNNHVLSAEEFLSCKGGAEDYNQQLASVVTLIKEAQAAKDQGKSQVLSQKIQEINDVIGGSETNVKKVSDIVESNKTKTSDGSKAALFKTNSANSTPTSVKTLSEKSKPNDTILNALEIKTGETVSGEITNKQNAAYYQFRYAGEHRDIIEVKLSNTSTTLTPQLVFYDHNKSKFHSAYDETAGANLNTKIAVEPNNTYYVCVTRYYSDQGSYQLLISEPLKAYDQYEANDDVFNATTIKVGQTVSANLLDPGDLDWYRVDDNSSDAIKVTFENGSSDLAPSITVYDQNKSKLTDQYNYTTGANLVFNVTVQPGTITYVSVGTITGLFTIARYRLTVASESQ